MIDGVYYMDVSNTYTTEPTDFDVVLIHGLSSSADTAWKNEINDLWPLWIKQFNHNCRVLLLNYPADSLFVSSTSKVTIKERAKGLADILPAIGVGLKPTIFICHSLGGIMVKEIIRSCITTGSSVTLAANTVGIVFLATPHRGSDLASLAKYFGSSLTKELKFESPYLLDLGSWFSEHASTADIKISCYYETQKYKGLLVVNKQSADPQCLGCNAIGVDKNHSTICKPISINDDIFVRINRDIRETIEKVNSMTRNITSIDEIITLPEITNQMYFDIINFLNRFFYESGGMNACIISNPCSGPRPCCIIVTQHASLKETVLPLVKRWPDRFAIHEGYVGELTSNNNNDNSSAIEPYKLKFAADKLAKNIAKLFTQLFNPVIDTNVCYMWEDENDVKALTAAHRIQTYVRAWCEKELDKALNDNKQQRCKANIEIWEKFDSIIQNEGKQIIRESLNTILSESVNELFKANNFRIKINHISSDFDKSKSRNYEPRLKCKVHSIDYEKDIAILIIDKSKLKNKTFKTWTTNHEYLLKYKGSKTKIRNTKIGDYCYSPAFKKTNLKVVDVNQNALFPLVNKISKITGIIVLSGEEPKQGDSGTPILNKDGNVVGMIIGKANYLSGKHTLAVSVLNNELENISKHNVLPDYNKNNK